MRQKRQSPTAILNSIGEIMVSRVVTAAPEETIVQAARKLAQRNIGVLPILEKGRLVGILSERDFVTKVVRFGLDPKKTPVSKVMTRKLFTARPEDVVPKVLNLMRRRHVRHVPVVDGTHRLLGIVSIRDLLTRVEQNLKSMVRKSVRDLSTDSLTGLYNYRFFNDYLDAEITRSQRRNYHFSLLFIDLDYFKIFNDTHGHAKGNLLLKEFAGFLKPPEERKDAEFCVRRSDIGVRLGGDEFVLVLPETIKEGAKICADRLRQTVQRYIFRFKKDRKEYRATISVGIAEFPGDAVQKDELIEKADQALYMAKRLGRNRVQLYSR